MLARVVVGSMALETPAPAEAVDAAVDLLRQAGCCGRRRRVMTAAVPEGEDPGTSDEGSASLVTPAEERFVSVTTFRRTGEPVATPVWVVRDGERGNCGTSGTTRVCCDDTVMPARASAATKPGRGGSGFRADWTTTSR